MRRAGHRRLLRRSRRQGRAGHRRARLSDRRGRRRRRLRRSPSRAAPAACVDRRTVTEQLLYEIHDPAAYLTPDVVADLTRGRASREVGPDRVRVAGARGQAGARDAQGDGLLRRAAARRGRDLLCRPERRRRGRACAARHRERAARAARAGARRLRVDLIGVVSIFGDDAGARSRPRRRGARDVRLRVAAAATTPREVELLLREVEALYSAGPAGGGGVRRRITPRLAQRLLPDRARTASAPRVIVRRTAAGMSARRPCRSTGSPTRRTGDKGNRSNIA